MYDTPHEYSKARNKRGWVPGRIVSTNENEHSDEWLAAILWWTLMNDDDGARKKSIYWRHPRNLSSSMIDLNTDSWQWHDNLHS